MKLSIIMLNKKTLSTNETQLNGPFCHTQHILHSASSVITHTVTVFIVVLIVIVLSAIMLSVLTFRIVNGTLL
jgi:hypothetical protein